MRYTNDPIADFMYHDAVQARQLKRLPLCSECGEHIQDEHCYQINDELICEDCMRGYRVLTEDVMN